MGNLKSKIFLTKNVQKEEKKFSFIRTIGRSIAGVARTVKKVITKTLYAGVILTTLGVCAVGAQMALAPQNTNLVGSQTVYSRVADYGITDDYLTLSKKASQLQEYFFGGKDVVVRLAMPKGQDTYKIYVDFEATPEQREAINEVIADYNQVFEMINPAYKFEADFDGSSLLDKANPYRTILQYKDIKLIDDAMGKATPVMFKNVNGGVLTHYNSIVLSPQHTKTKEEFASVFRHEFMHTLGIADAYIYATEDTNSIMQAGYNGFFKVDDLLLLDALYRPADSKTSTAEVSRALKAYALENSDWYKESINSVSSIKELLTPENLENLTGKKCEVETSFDELYAVSQDCSDQYMYANSGYRKYKNLTATTWKFDDGKFTMDHIDVNTKSNTNYGGNKYGYTAEIDGCTLRENFPGVIFKYDNTLYNARITTNNDLYLEDLGTVVTKEQYETIQNNMLEIAENTSKEENTEKDTHNYLAKSILNKITTEDVKELFSMNFNSNLAEAKQNAEDANYQWDTTLGENKDYFVDADKNYYKFENGVLTIKPKNSSAYTVSNLESLNGLYACENAIFAKYGDTLLKLDYTLDLTKNKVEFSKLNTKAFEQTSFENVSVMSNDAGMTR